MMNIKTIYAVSASMLAMAGLASCTSESTNEPLVLSVTSYTFDYKGEKSLTVELNTSGASFTAEQDAAFINVSEPDGNTVTVTVQENPDPVYRSGVVEFTCGGKTASLKVDQEPRRFVGPFVELPLNSYACMSANGKYVAYVAGRWTDATMTNWVATAHMIDTETGEVTDLYLPKPQSTPTFSGVQAVSDDGRIVVFFRMESTEQAMTIDGEVVEVSVPEGYTEPHVEYVSPDGTIWVGYCYDTVNIPGSGETSFYRPTIWRNGEPEVLDCPTKDIFGIDHYNGTIARGCSDDGSVVYGSEWRYMGLIYWKDGVMYPIGPDNAEVTGNGLDPNSSFTMIQSFANNFGLSANGKWLTARYPTGPVRVNTETGSYEIMESAGGNYIGNTVTNDGIVISQGYGGGCSVVDFDNGTATSIEDYFASNYGITVNSYNVVRRVSADGNVWFGTHIYPVESSLTVHWFCRVDN